MTKKRLTFAWITAIIFFIGVPLWIILCVVIDNPDNQAWLSFTFGITFLCLIVNFFLWLFYAWDTEYTFYLTARIMYVNRWSYDKKTYETVYFVEWEHNTKRWWMGILLSDKNTWNEANYRDSKGFETKELAKELILSEIKELKPKKHIREIKEIEVFIVDQELEKITIE